MFDTINGLPVHALVVHGVVVLLPLAVLGTLAIAARPAWRRSYGLLVASITVVATALVPVATQSGLKLATHVGTPEHHKQLGQQLIWFALPMLVLVVVLVVLDRRPSATAAVNVVAGLAVVAAVATGVQVYRVGEAGSHAVWDGKTDQTISSR
ncbi:MAG: hypothetical protein J7518_02790 [Nocardioidaceae bacterium]|nr:hypothetical protein [Nocardioidaceae bacterium]